MKTNKMKKPFTKPTPDSDDKLSDYEDVPGSDSDDELLQQLHEESEDESSEEEVLPIHSESESSDDEKLDVSDDEDGNISDSDISGAEDNLPDSKAWGKKAKNFYNANIISEKQNFADDEEEELAKMEEMEAKTIQQRLLAELDDADLSLDLLSDVIATQKETKKDAAKELSKVEIDLSQLKESEKLNLIKNECPELLVYVEDYKRLMTCVRDELLPVLAKLKDKKFNNSNIMEFVKIYYQIIMNYCINITFYVMLKAKKIDTKSHPVSDWLEKLKSTLEESDPIYKQLVKLQLPILLARESKEKKFSKKRKIKSDSVDVMQKKVKSDIPKKAIKENVPGLEEEIEADQLSDDEAVGNETKRPITYQIAKNKGLTPHRKKELRNPRVKYRMKFKQAKIRRKGQVREVRKELRKYAGEISGIKAGVVKSVKFKV